MSKAYTEQRKNYGTPIQHFATSFFSALAFYKYFTIVRDAGNDVRHVFRHQEFLYTWNKWIQNRIVYAG